MNRKAFLVFSLIIVTVFMVVPDITWATEISIFNFNKLDTNTTIRINSFKDRVRKHNPERFERNLFSDSETIVEYDEYLRGVLTAEVDYFTGEAQDQYPNQPTLADKTAREAYKAQGIASTNFFWNRKETASDPADYKISGDTTDQAFLLVEGDTAISQSQQDIARSVDEIVHSTTVDVMKGNVINRDAEIVNQIFKAGFFAGTPLHYTLSRERSPCFDSQPDYSLVERSTLSSESMSKGIEECDSDDVGNMVGLSQDGTIKLAARSDPADRWNHKQILKHYYGPAPPYLKEVTIQEKSNGSYSTTYADSWGKGDEIWTDQTDLEGQNPTRTHSVKQFSSKDNGDTVIRSPFKLSLSFSEIVSCVNGARITIGGFSKSGTDLGGSGCGNPKPYFDLSEALDRQDGTQDPPEKWTIEFSRDRILNGILNGEVGDTVTTIDVQAQHEAVPEWGLDENPKTMAFQHNPAGDWKNYEPFWEEEKKNNWTKMNSSKLPKNAGTDTNHKIITDYYRPFLKKVKVTQKGPGGQFLIYQAEWVRDGDQLKLKPAREFTHKSKGKTRQVRTANLYKDLTFTLTFSEPIKILSILS